MTLYVPNGYKEKLALAALPFHFQLRMDSSSAQNEGTIRKSH